MLEDAAGIRRVVLACGTVDLRKGIDGLAMIIGDQYGQNPFEVSAKYSCGFPDPQVLPIIIVDRYLVYFTTIMEDRLWQVRAKLVFRWRNRYQ